MKRFAIALALMLAVGSPALAAGLMQPKDSSLPELQIQDHQVRVVINNGFAVTEVDQTFYNPNDVDLDAIYTFPLPKDAALSELSLWIDGAEVIGEVVEKEEARQLAATERDAGRETALAEQREYFAYDVLVSPVRAQDTARVRLVYLQPIEIDGGMGRYVYPLEEGRIDEEMHAFWDRRPEVHGKFSFECILRSSYPLDDVRAKGFSESVVTNDSSGEWRIWVDGAAEGTSLDQDIVVYYRLAEGLPARVDLLPYRGEDGAGTFMIVITPGADLQDISEGIDWSIVLDISGSMAGKIATAADALSRALDQLRSQDRFRVVVFANRTRELTRGWTPVTDVAVDRAREKLLALGTEGGTNLYGGFQAGLRDLDADRTSALILVSDGGANIGPTQHRDFLKLLEKKDVRVFTFVMGQGANRPLLGRLADASGGFSMDVSNQDDLYGRIEQAKAKLARQALHGVKVDLQGGRVAELTPQPIPSAYFGEQIVLFGRYFEPGDTRLRLGARISGEDRSWETRVRLPDHDETYPEIERLWALARIQELERQIDDGDDGSELREAVVDLGTGYSLVSNYTSMIVMREERFEELGIERKNKQRTDAERTARESRAQNVVQPTRADKEQPMFGGRSANHGSRGGGGAGAAGPAFLGLLAGLYGVRYWLRRRSDRP
jgi:Ca-activated chloride channel family protein